MGQKSSRKKEGIKSSKKVLQGNGGKGRDLEHNKEKVRGQTQGRKKELGCVQTDPVFSEGGGNPAQGCWGGFMVRGGKKDSPFFTKRLRKGNARIFCTFKEKRGGTEKELRLRPINGHNLEGRPERKKGGVWGDYSAKGGM